jgi:hypothetical protein
MKSTLIIFSFFFINLSIAQITVDKATFEKSEIKVISTKTIESSTLNKKAVLKFEFIDLSDGFIKNYEADLNYNGFVTVKSHRSMLDAIGAISVMSVPFKIRQKNRLGFITAKADVKNIGLYFPLSLWERKRYWLDNSTSLHKFSFGVLVAPMAEELSDKNTDNYFQNSAILYSAFFMSTSLTFTYTYKNITFAYIPIGVDFGTDNAGKKWDNHGNFWTGFGIGIDTKMFGF